MKTTPHPDPVSVLAGFIVYAQSATKLIAQHTAGADGRCPECRAGGSSTGHVMAPCNMLLAANQAALIAPPPPPVAVRPPRDYLENWALIRSVGDMARWHNRMWRWDGDEWQEPAGSDGATGGVA